MVAPNEDVGYDELADICESPPAPKPQICCTEAKCCCGSIVYSQVVSSLCMVLLADC